MDVSWLVVLLSRRVAPPKVSNQPLLVLLENVVENLQAVVKDFATSRMQGPLLLPTEYSVHGDALLLEVIADVRGVVHVEGRNQVLFPAVLSEGVDLSVPVMAPTADYVKWHWKAPLLPDVSTEEQSAVEVCNLVFGVGSQGV